MPGFLTKTKRFMKKKPDMFVAGVKNWQIEGTFRANKKIVDVVIACHKKIGK